MSEVKSLPNQPSLFGENVIDRYCINSDSIIIDIFIRQDDIETKKIDLEGEIIKIRTLNSQIELYKELLNNTIEKIEYRNKLQNILNILTDI